jgi:hypothetical protein
MNIFIVYAFQFRRGLLRYAPMLPGYINNTPSEAPANTPSCSVFSSVYIQIFEGFFVLVIPVCADSVNEQNTMKKMNMDIFINLFLHIESISAGDNFFVEGS